MAETKVSTEAVSGEPSSEAIFGRFHLVCRIGRGGMADVYLAVMPGPAGVNKLVALKVLREDEHDEGTVSDGTSTLQMFLDEARLAAHLSHTNIVQMFEVGEYDGRAFMAMEYLEGRAYSTVLRRIEGPATEVPKGPTPFSLGLKLLVLNQALSGLHHAHELRTYDGDELRLVHRDVSPQNIFITYDGVVKILDFGIAKTTESSVETKQGFFKGKVRYMAPEQLRGGQVDRRADLYAVGVMLWEAIAGRKYRSGTDAEVVRQVIEGGMPAIEEVVPDCPTELAAICARALAHDREDRYATAAEMQAALEAFIATPPEMRCGTRDLGQLVASAFAEERHRMRAMVRASLEDLKARFAGGLSSGLLPPAAPSSNLSLRLEGGPGWTDSNSARAAARLDAAASSMQGLSLAPASGLPPQSLDPAIDRTAHPALIPLKRNAWYAVGGALLAVAIVALFSGRIRRFATASSSQPPTISNPTPAAETAPAAPASPRTYPFTIIAKPPNATITLDGHRAKSNPLTVDVAHDGSQHQVRVEASGYEPSSSTVTYDGSPRPIEISLKRVTAPPSPPQPPGHGRPTAPVTAVGAASHTPTKPPNNQPQRPIDDNIFESSPR
jgi:eukaryotic-like serine/threonine-protein kinase